MLLKRLTLVNFRPFKGEHIMEFSTDKEKNVTLVMAENGAGKTTLAQAFQWALYLNTDGFKNKSVLNSLVEKEMMAGSEASVVAKLELEHNDVEYIIVRKQVYKKDLSGFVKPESPELEVYYIQGDGQTVVNNPLKNRSIISSILPESLSKYFFFDGERIEKMAGEVTSGKSDEFKNAVQNILGLTALTNAIEHLNPNSKNSVIGRYNARLDAAGDQHIKELRESIYNYDEKLRINTAEIDKCEEELKFYTSEIEKTKNEILAFADVERMQQELNMYHDNLAREKQFKNNTIMSLMSNFSKNTYGYFSRKLINDALLDLKETDNIDKGIPYIRKETIQFLLEKKKCLCGCDLSEPTSHAVQELIETLKFIPPQSLGSAINQFQTSASFSIKSSENYYDNFKSQISTIRSCSNRIEELEHNIGEIDEVLLKSSNTKVKDLKSRQVEMEKTVSYLNNRINELKVSVALDEENKKTAESEISKLQLKVEINKQLELQMNYARAAYNRFRQTYDYQENLTRTNLEAKINELFKQIYAGGMTINIDEKYKITSYVNELDDELGSLVDANTAKSYSIIFAFIVGVISLAKQKALEKTEDASIVTDEYPLVMDAPLSSFDQRRIKNICEVIPGIARQVIIFIKDTDGNIAKNEMHKKIGMEYEVTLRDKEIPVDSKITKVGEY